MKISSISDWLVLIVLSCPFFLFSQKGMAQSSKAQIQVPIPMSSPLTPEASGLMKEINYPINYSTGLPDIKIPIFDIVSGDLKLPIYISFHASGHKVEDLSGLIGLNWTLHIAPTITRSINGSDDFQGYLNPTNPVLPFEQPSQYPVYKQNIHSKNPHLDEEPDDFYYSFIGESGRFSFKRTCPTCSTFEAITFPYKAEHKVARVNNNGLELKDGNGVTYLYNELQYSSGRGQGAEIVEFKCKKISSATGKGSISFLYKFQSGTIPSTNRHVDYARITYAEPLEATRSGGYLYHKNNKYTLHRNITTRQINYSSADAVATGSIVPPAINYITNPLFLDKVEFQDGYIRIEGTPYEVSKLKIYNHSDQLLKEITFVQGTLSSNSTKRILKEMIIAAPGQVNQVYAFGYFGNHGMKDLDPRFDHWGYFNGNGSIIPPNSTSERSIPSLTLPLNIFSFNNSPILDTLKVLGGNKEPNLDATKSYMLERITYPTGGSTVFEYELNKYLNSSNQLKPAGGLRIVKISNYDGATQTSKRQFVYGVNENNAGYLVVNPSVNDYMKETLVFEYDSGTGFSSIQKSRSKTWHNTSQIDLFHSNGSSVRYPVVTEYEEDQMGNTKGKTVYNFKVDPAGSRPYWILPNILPAKYRNDNWMSGQLVKKEIYARVATQYKLARKEEYNYAYESLFDKSIPYKIKGSIGQIAPVIENTASFWQTYGSDFIYIVPAYEYTGMMRLTDQTVTDFDLSNMLETRQEVTYSYESAQHSFPTKIIS